VGLYVATCAVLMGILYLARPCPPYVAILLCLSRRVHSIFVLRLFNDAFAMLLLYLAVLVFCTTWRSKVRCALVLLCCAVLCCAVLCCAVLCCAVLCCAVLCCAVLCCAVLCCAVLLLRDV
jgi:hypothetical protein